MKMSACYDVAFWLMMIVFVVLEYQGKPSTDALMFALFMCVISHLHGIKERLRGGRHETTTTNTRAT